MIRALVKKFPVFERTAVRLYAAWARFRAERLGIGFRDWTIEDREALRAVWDQRQSERNHLLLERIAHYGPDSVLEVGSGCGAVLSLVAQRFPQALVTGVELNPVAAACGNEWMREEGLTNARLEPGRAEQLQQYPDKGFDIVFSSAALMYVKPEDIAQVLRNTVRIARKAVVLLEMHDDAVRNYLGEFHLPSNWKRNYRRIFREIGVPDDRISIEPVSERLWQPGGGGGAYIEVRLS